jgi:hypothetical protein
MPGFEEEATSNEQSESFDEVVIVRLREDHEPQLVEITSPLQKILVQRVDCSRFQHLKISLNSTFPQIVDEQLLPRMASLNRDIVTKLLKDVGRAAAKVICRNFIYADS